MIRPTEARFAIMIDLARLTPKPRHSAIWGLLCIGVLVVILNLGLWPFHAPANQVTWLQGGGVDFGRAAVAFTAESINLEPDAQTTIEIWLQPTRRWGSGTILSTRGTGNRYQFWIRQSLTDLRLQLEDRNAPKSETNVYLPQIFFTPKPAFFTITSGPQGTRIYEAGALVATFPHFRIPAEVFHSQLIVAGEPLQPDSWSGSVHGLAVYGTTLSAEEVAQHYDSWKTRDAAQVHKTADADHCVALYLFNEGHGNIVRNEMRPGVLDLHIPQRYQVLDKEFMEPVWREFRFSRSYFSAALKNIVGFVPLGFCFYPYLISRGSARPVLITVLAGTIISLTIEVLQAFLPTRDSGMTDVLTNTLGTWLGVVLFRRTADLLKEVFQ